PADSFALLPLLLAIAGVILVGPGGRGRSSPRLAAFSRTADVSWCAASLFSKQLMLVHEALLEPTTVAYWLTIVAAVVRPIVFMLVLPRRVRPWVLFGVGVFGALVVLGDTVYYRFFGDVLSAPALLGAHQAGRAWGSIRSLLTLGMLWLVVDFPFAFWLVIRLSRLSSSTPAPLRLAAAAMVGLAALAAVGDQDVMPHLRRWIADSLRFTNVTDQTSEGRTSDAEFVSLVSLLPLDHGAVAFQYPGNHYVGLPRVLAERGYATVSAVPFEPGFWNRRVMHPSYGFQQSLFESDFQLTEQIGWGLNDRDFLQQMVPRLEKLPRPFGAWLITLSLHHPFEDFPTRHKVLKLGGLEGTSFGNYLHTMRFFDQ